MRKLFGILTLGAGALYGRMAVEFVLDGLPVMAALSILVSAWYMFGMKIVKRLEVRK